MFIEQMVNEIVEKVLEKNTKNIKTNNTVIVPCNTNVIVKFYEDNPYNYIEKTSAGLILGINGEKKYKSNETGEMEDAEEYIACAKVIAVGPACKNVSVGDDVFAVKHIATPLPYRNKGYRAVTEQNIICIIQDENM